MKYPTVQSNKASMTGLKACKFKNMQYKNNDK